MVSFSWFLLVFSLPYIMIICVLKRILQKKKAIFIKLLESPIPSYSPIRWSFARGLPCPQEKSMKMHFWDPSKWDKMCVEHQRIKFHETNHYWSIFCQASLKSFPVVILCIGIVFGFQNIIHPNHGWVGGPFLLRVGGNGYRGRGRWGTKAILIKYNSNTWGWVVRSWAR